ADDVTTTWTRFFLINRNRLDAMAPPTVTIRAAGQPTDPVTVQLPGAPGFFEIGYLEEAFLYWVARPTQRTFFTFRSDGSFMRQLKVPADIDPVDPKLDFYWSDHSKYLLTRDLDGHVLVHSTVDFTDFDLGIRPKLLGVIGSVQLL